MDKIVSEMVKGNKSDANKWNVPKRCTLLMRACADCHFNETKCSWYSNVASVSWVVQHDVDERREYFDTSTLLSSCTYRKDYVKQRKKSSLKSLQYILKFLS